MATKNTRTAAALAFVLTLVFIALLTVPVAFVWMLVIGNLHHAFGWMQPISLLDSYFIFIPLALAKAIYSNTLGAMKES